jgi:hypothetical protein
MFWMLSGGTMPMQGPAPRRLPVAEFDIAGRDSVAIPALASV